MRLDWPTIALVTVLLFGGLALAIFGDDGLLHWAEALIAGSIGLAIPRGVTRPKAGQ